MAVAKVSSSQTLTPTATVQTAAKLAYMKKKIEGSVSKSLNNEEILA